MTITNVGLSCCMDYHFFADELLIISIRLLAETRNNAYRHKSSPASLSIYLSVLQCRQQNRFGLQSSMSHVNGGEGITFCRFKSCLIGDIFPCPCLCPCWGACVHARVSMFMFMLVPMSVSTHCILYFYQSLILAGTALLSPSGRWPATGPLQSPPTQHHLLHLNISCLSHSLAE